MGDIFMIEFVPFLRSTLNSHFELTFNMEFTYEQQEGLVTARL